MVPLANTKSAIPEPTGWSKQQVQLFAESVATQLGFKPGNDMEAVVKSLGGSIAKTDWESARDTGSIVVEGRQNFTIHLSPFSGGTRARFTIAHELGHYFLHAKMGELAPLSITRDGDNRAEWEANWFAAGFLMPSALFRQKLAERFSTAELADYFGVSEAAVDVRKKTA